MGNTTEGAPRRSRLSALAGLLAGLVTVRLRRFEIAGDSMRPTLNDGDWVLALAHPRRVGSGDVVVFDHPDRPGFDLVKRVQSFGPDGVVVLGDDPSAGSVDSVTFGPVAAAAVEARVIARYRPWPPRIVR